MSIHPDISSLELTHSIVLGPGSTGLRSFKRGLRDLKRYGCNEREPPEKIVDEPLLNLIGFSTMGSIQMILLIFREYWLTIILALMSLRFLSNKFDKNLRKIPEPFLAGYTDLWRFLDCLLGTPHETHIKLHQQYSDLVRIGPHSVLFSNPALIATIYGSQNDFTKTSFYTLLMMPHERRFTPSVFTARDEKYHAAIRKPVVGAYSMSALLESESRVDSTMACFMKRLDEFAVSQNLADLGELIQMFTFDVVGEITFSERLGFLETLSDTDNIMADIRAKTFLGATFGQVPVISATLGRNPLIALLFGNHPVVKIARRNIRKQRQQLDQSSGKTQNFMRQCFRAQEKYPNLITDGLVQMYSIENVIAGSGTTAIALRAVCMSSCI